MKNLKTIIGIVFSMSLLIVNGAVQAHTTSIGFVPGTNPGEVTFWTGSYEHGGGTPNNEADLTLAGINSTVFGPVTAAFNITPVNVKPIGLVDGTNNFYWEQPQGSALNTSLTADPGIAGGVAWWQGVTFAGLNAGDYSFSCGTTCGTTVQWDTWGPGTENITLVAGNIGGGGTNGTIPEPGMLALMGIGIFGLMGVRRRKQSL
tara:strand:- start:734 stop:1345 length:612 start_codon:yes stop_codon:yes gene_type:complete